MFFEERPPWVHIFHVSKEFCEGNNVHILSHMPDLPYPRNITNRRNIWFFNLQQNFCYKNDQNTRPGDHFSPFHIYTLTGVIFISMNCPWTYIALRILSRFLPIELATSSLELISRNK